MAFQFIGSGGLLDATELSSYESQLAEGDRALLELDLRLPVSASVAQTLEDQLKQRGIPEVRVVTASPMLRIYWRKGFPWLFVIATLVLLLAILIIGWRLFKEVAAVIPPVPLSIGLIALIVLGIVILARRR